MSADVASVSTYLFARASFIRGLGRAVDIFASYRNCSYNVSRSPQEADARAMRIDAAALKSDMRRALQQVHSELGR